jgi:hypothetical protein
MKTARPLLSMVWNKLMSFLFPSRHGVLIAGRASGISRPLTMAGGGAKRF